MGVVFEVTVTLPPLPADDVIASRKLSVAADGGAAEDVPVPDGADTVTLPTKYPNGAALEATLVHTDEAGNDSPPRSASLTVSDTVAPAEPGEFGMSVGAQSFEPDAGGGGAPPATHRP
jgi:hypothetical protein